jgi:hypothetical protein
MRSRDKASYETLVEMAANGPSAWDQWQRLRAIREDGGSPEITHNRKSGFNVRDRYPLPPKKRP